MAGRCGSEGHCGAGRLSAGGRGVVRHHHEDYDGGGYPAGLAGEKIPLLARIIRVADACDAMTPARPYRGPLSRDRALEELRRSSGRHFDPRVVEAFLRMQEHEIKGPGKGPLLTER